MKEITTPSTIGKTQDEDEITLVEHDEPDIERSDDNESITLKIRSTRKRDHVNVTRRLQDIERRVKKDMTLRFRVVGILEAFEQVIVWFDVWIKRLLSRIFVRKGSPHPFKLRLTIAVLLILCVIICGIVVFSHNNTRTKASHIEVLNTEGVRNIRLSPLLITDTGRNILNSKELPAGRPFYAEFDVLDWNEQLGQRLDLSLDVRVFSEKGKIELFRPDLVRYAQGTDAKTEKVHVKVYFNFTREALSGEYRLSFAVTEMATQRKAVMETRITIKNS